VNSASQLIICVRSTWGCSSKLIPTLHWSAAVNGFSLRGTLIRRKRLHPFVRSATKRRPPYHFTDKLSRTNFISQTITRRNVIVLYHTRHFGPAFVSSWYQRNCGAQNLRSTEVLWILLGIFWFTLMKINMHRM